MKTALSLAGTTAVIATAAACDVLTTGRPGLLPLAVVAAGAGGAAAWAVATRAACRFGLGPAVPPGGRFILLAVALAFALADAYAAALTSGARPFLLPTTFLLVLSGALSGAANTAALALSASDRALRDEQKQKADPAGENGRNGGAAPPEEHRQAEEQRRQGAGEKRNPRTELAIVPE